jgi:hypothetical protein
MIENSFGQFEQIEYNAPNPPIITILETKLIEQIETPDKGVSYTIRIRYKLNEPKSEQS